MDRAAARKPAANGGVTARIMAAGADPQVDLLDLIGDRPPGGNRVAAGARQLAAQPGLDDQALELAGQRDGVPGGNSRPRSPSPVSSS